MPFALTTPPGFADLPDSALEAEKPALGLLLARIAGNAEFGAVRPEIFIGKYRDGETVLMPKSTVDGYQYKRSELIYCWGIYSTVNPDSGWITGPGPLWYCGWKVDQTTGLVSCTEWYRNSEGDINSNSGTSNDGVLQVFTIAQRGRTEIVVAQIPNFEDVADTDIMLDDALRTSHLQQLNRNAKYSCLAGEVFYLGEYVNGQTVALPVSPADKYPYSIGECKFTLSWRWTCAGAAFTQPDYHLGQLHRMTASIDPATGVVSTAINYFNSGVKPTTHGRVAVFAFCERTAATVTKVTVTPKTPPWKVSGSLNAAFPFGRGDGGSPLRVPLAMTAGDTIAITYISGTVRISDARPFVDALGQVADPSGTTLSDGKRFPTFYVAGSVLGKGGASACWVDDDGQIIDDPFDLGLGGSFTVPVGATGLQIGVNDVQFNDNIGDGFIFAVTVNGAAPSITFSSPAFTEIAPEAFFAGNPDPEVLMAAIANNIRLSLVRQETFGPFLYANGVTIPRPTSTIDGYLFQRDEMQYVYEVATTGPESGTLVDIRFWELDNYVDTAGVVHIHQSRVPQGGGNVSSAEGQLRVLIVGVRNTPQDPIYDPTFDPRPPGDDPSGDQTFLVDGTSPGDLGPLTIANVNAHNTSAWKKYIKANFPSNFTGQSCVARGGVYISVNPDVEDDSQNPATPGHISHESISLMLPGHTGLACGIGVHNTNWWGSNGHVAMGYNSTDPAWVKAAVDEKIACGLKYISLYWGGPGHFTDTTCKLFQTEIATRGGAIKFLIDVNRSALTRGSMTALITYLQANYLSDPNYQQYSGKPIIQFFDAHLDVGDAGMVAAKAATTGAAAFWMPNGDGKRAQAWVDGCYGWPQPWTTGIPGLDKANTAALGTFITNMEASGKPYFVTLYKAFNGTETKDEDWSLGKAIPHQDGKTWIDVCAYQNTNIGPGCIGAMLATWNDYEEGTGFESGIENSLAVAAAIATHFVNFSVSGGTGDESTLAHYTILASSDGANLTALANVNTGVGTYDLSTAGLTVGTAYTIFVQAIGKPMVRCQLSAGVAYTA